MCGSITRRARHLTAAAPFLLGAWGGLAAADPAEIRCAADLGLPGTDVPVSASAKIAYLVNPAINRKADLDRLLTVDPRRDPPPSGWAAEPFGAAEVQALEAAGRPGNTVAYEAVADPAESFFKFMFSQVPWTERSLQGIVEEVNREEFPLAALDASPRIVRETDGKGRWMETLVSLRLFLVRVESDRDRNRRWVTRCELFYEDQAVGRAPCPPGGDAVGALSASVLDALRGKIALGFTRTPAVRRASGKLDEPRRDLIDRSLSEPAPAPEREPSAAPGGGEASPGPAPQPARRDPAPGVTGGVEGGMR
jgi:hypothetical protein